MDDSVQAVERSSPLFTSESESFCFGTSTWIVSAWKKDRYVNLLSFLHIFLCGSKINYKYFYIKLWSILLSNTQSFVRPPKTSIQEPEGPIHHLKTQGRNLVKTSRNNTLKPWHGLPYASATFNHIFTSCIHFSAHTVFSAYNAKLLLSIHLLIEILPIMWYPLPGNLPSLI